MATVPAERNSNSRPAASRKTLVARLKDHDLQTIFRKYLNSFDTKHYFVTDYLKKKEFEKLFTPLQTEADIRVLKRVDKLPVLLIDTVLRLATLDFIKYILVSDNEIKASNESKEKRLKIPISEAGHLTAMGICIIFHLDYKTIDFDEINSPTKGNGQKMVDCVLKDFPKDWQAGIFMDWSGGFWDKMKEKYKNVRWLDY